MTGVQTCALPICSNQLIEVIVNEESGWRPSGICCMTCFTGGGQIEGQVTRISAGCIIIGMATGAGCGRIVVVALVTVVAGYGRVRTRERPHGAVIESCRCPCCLTMTVSTCGWELLSDVIGVSRCVIVIGVTTCTGVWCIVVIAVVAGCTVVGNGCVRSNQLIEVIVNGERSGRPSGICGMTCFTGGGQIQRDVTWICAG